MISTVLGFFGYTVSVILEAIQQTYRENVITRTANWDSPGGAMDRNLQEGAMGLIPGPGRFHMPWSN